ncbi:MAG: MerR family transcriptional regulator [Lachnospiraceae bacterium]|nr:MerR family transcriptional regulator [Lachnospiraceae bacterium]
MTIREFAGLCGCNPQTLRYYDHVNLLKPVKVDEWTGYRYYEEDQALVYVQIRNLQKAGFSIEEVKELLGQDSQVIFRAFEKKIAEAEQRLEEMRAIQKSYQTEMREIQEKIREVKEQVLQSMREYDPEPEFGISAGEYAGIMNSVTECFDGIDETEYDAFAEGEEPKEEQRYLDLPGSPDYETVYERHGWAYAREFFAECTEAEDGAEYALVFRVIPEKAKYGQAFLNTAITLMLNANEGKKRSFTADIGDSADGQNHFWLLKKKN